MSQMPSEPDDTQMVPDPDNTQMPPMPPAARNRPDWRQTLTSQMITNQQLTAHWLYERGYWIFGGLIVVALVLLQDLITSNFADRGAQVAALIAALAIVIALPFDLGGVVIVRYFNDLQQGAAVNDETLRRQAIDPQVRRKTMDTAVSTALFLGVLFTLISIGAALWHLSWAATILFFIACVLSLWLVSRAIR